MTVTPHADRRRHAASEGTRRARRRARRAGSAPATRPTRSRDASTGSRAAAVVDGVGAAARALEIAVEYAKERRQFDAPIGSFQAVQHLCADMLRAVELAPRRGLLRVLGGRRRRPGGAPPRRDDGAGVRGRRALQRRRVSAIQVLGGIGFTWEHDIHLFYKRLLTLQHTGGGAVDQLEELAAIVLD